MRPSLFFAPPAALPPVSGQRSRIPGALALSLLALSLSVLAPLALAERADRDKPINLEADRISVDDSKRVQVLEGNVVLTQGTRILRAARIVITEDQYGFQLGSATGGPRGLAYFRQKRDGRNEYMEGEAEQIDYNTRTEIAEFFRRAWVKSGSDQVRGDYIWYDSIAEKYTVNTGSNAGNASSSTPGRVRATLQPKKERKDGEIPAPATPAGTAGVTLQPAERLAQPPAR